ncbi:MAG TPA: zinc ribbon domain-containing protein [Fimbriimonadaceae bacterium]|nr:zinc ribbon domain-containing protein [Fimbriimonadaceae bacterium]
MLREVLFTNPHWVILGILIWIPVFAMVWMLIGGMIMGDVEPLTGLFGLCVAIGLGVLGIKPPDPSLTPLIFFAAVCTWVLLPFIRVAMNRRELTKMRIEAVESAYESLYQRPGNLGAQLKLAKALFDQGMIGSAVRIGEKTLHGVSRRDYADELRMLKHWQYRLGQAPVPDVRCSQCSANVPPEECFCQRCGRPHLLDYARGWTKSVAFVKIMAAWAMSLVVTVGVPLLTQSAPPVVALTTIPVLIGLAGFILWRSFVPRGAA